MDFIQGIFVFFLSLFDVPVMWTGLHFHFNILCCMYLKHIATHPFGRLASDVCHQVPIIIFNQLG